MFTNDHYHCCNYYNYGNKNMISFFICINNQSGESNHSVVSRIGRSWIVQQRSVAVAH